MIFKTLCIGKTIMTTQIFFGQQLLFWSCRKKEKKLLCSEWELWVVPAIIISKAHVFVIRVMIRWLLTLLDLKTFSIIKSLLQLQFSHSTKISDYSSSSSSHVIITYRMLISWPLWQHFSPSSAFPAF